jgi:hypothetical protein
MSRKAAYLSRRERCDMAVSNIMIGLRECKRYGPTPGAAGAAL